MKNRIFVSIIMLISMVHSSTLLTAQVKQSALQPAQITERVGTRTGLTAHNYLLKQGYVKEKVLHSQQYTITDSVGVFTVVVIATSYTNKAKTTAEHSYIEITRGKGKEIIQYIDEPTRRFAVQNETVSLQRAARKCDPVAIARASISTASSCKDCVNKVIECINNNKNAWRLSVCIVTKATVPCVRCVGNFATLIKAIIACK